MIREDRESFILRIEKRIELGRISVNENEVLPFFCANYKKNKSFDTRIECVFLLNCIKISE